MPLSPRFHSEQSQATILLTGFGAFPSVAENVTSLFVPKLAEAARRRFPACRIHAEILPVDWTVAPQRAAKLIRDRRPDIVLHFGVSARADSFVIETCAHNARECHPDARNAFPASECIAALGDWRLTATTLPAVCMVARLARIGVRGKLSRDAGRYLCNATLYRSLIETHGTSQVVGFIHMPIVLHPDVPLTTSSLRPRQTSTLTWGMALSGGLEMLDVCLESI